MAKFIPVTEFRGKVLEAVRRAEQTGEAYIITARGRPAAVLISFADWESIAETNEILRDRKTMQEIRKSQRYFARGGKGVSMDDIDWS